MTTTYQVEKNVGKYGAGSRVSETDFIPGRIDELLKMGVVTPIYDTPGAESLEAENRRLRTAVGGPSQEARIVDLESENRRLKADLAAAQNALADTTLGMVRKAEHDRLNDRFNQQSHLLKTAQEEIDRLKSSKK